ncbi:MAG: lysoplasmalogenase [Thermoanaerobaculaceae bacterium]|jgi:uncharacterized membrane protein YhhN
MNSPGEVALIAVVAAAVAALVAAELSGRRLGAVVAKTVASAGFVLLALLGSGLATPYGRWVLLALAACMAGDVLLAVPRAFAAGLASFLVAHVGYIVAFSTVLPPRAWPRLVAAVVVVPGVAAAVWLWPHLGRLRVAVLAYIAVITLMTWGAIAVAGRAGWMTCAAGILFYVSDLTVARDRFVVRRFASRAWGLPAYYLAQVLFALTLSR